MTAPTVISAVVPLVSVLIGAGLTYWFNVRTRRRTQTEDLFDRAISAVAVADASKSYLRSVSRPEALSERAHRVLLSSIAAAAVENHTKRCAEAREALAGVLRFEPAIKPYYADAEAVVAKPDEIIAVLIEARERHT